MTIRQDAGEMLLYVYNQYVQRGVGELANSETFQKESGWNKIRMNNALEYLWDKKLIDVHKHTSVFGLRILSPAEFEILKILPEGIDMIEDKKKFENAFGMEVNLGLIKFSWGIHKNE